MATRGGRSDWRFVVGPAICGGLREIAWRFTGGRGYLYALTALRCGGSVRACLSEVADDGELAGWRRVLAAVVGVAALVAALSAIVPLARAESFSVTSSPAGAAVEIDGAVVSTTPFRVDYPGGYFHKAHTVFGSRLDHSMTVRVSKSGYLTEQVTLTQGPFEWIAVNGRHRGNYFLLKSGRFDIKLDPVSHGSTPVETIGRDGPLRPSSAAMA